MYVTKAKTVMLRIERQRMSKNYSLIYGQLNEHISDELTVFKDRFSTNIYENSTPMSE